MKLHCTRCGRSHKHKKRGLCDICIKETATEYWERNKISPSHLRRAEQKQSITNSETTSVLNDQNSATLFAGCEGEAILYDSPPPKE